MADLQGVFLKIGVNSGSPGSHLVDWPWARLPGQRSVIDPLNPRAMLDFGLGNCSYFGHENR